MNDTLLQPVARKGEYKNRNADEKQGSLHHKFPKDSFLGNQKNVDHFMQWITFFRRNLHRFATDYLGLKLFWYQIFILYLFGINKMNVIIASRASAKSYIVALYACCRCILYPYSMVVIASPTKNQSKLIVSEKIEKELMRDSPPLRKEIKSIKQNQNEVVVLFHNGSTITVVPASENGRGYRSTVVIRDEYRMLSKKVDDSVLSPFQIVRQTPYRKDEQYANIPELIEESVDVYISSSWLDNGHWMWDIADQSFKDMLNGKGSVLLAFDESVALKHSLKTQSYFRTEKKKISSLFWKLEFLNERVKENEQAFFTYTMMNENQRCMQPFYPETPTGIKNIKKNPYFLPKQHGEIRVVAADMAFVSNKKENDNSVYCCVRLIPEKKTYESENGNVVVNNGYRRVVCYLEAFQGGEITKQACRIRFLMESFDADYLVLDTRNGGLATLDLLQKPIYDPETSTEYSAIGCMNNDNFANRSDSSEVRKCIFAVNASQRLNSEIANSFRNALYEKKIDFLIPFDRALEEVLSKNTEYNSTPEAYVQSFFEAPFLETNALVEECINLNCEILPQTGVVVLKENSNARKDRYSSVSYCNYFCDILERELSQISEEYEYVCFIN